MLGKYPIAAAILMVANAVSASEAVYTFKMPETMSVVRFLNLDGLDGGYPLMELEDFCNLPVNAENFGENCTLDAVIQEGKEVSFQT